MYRSTDHRPSRPPDFSELLEAMTPGERLAASRSGVFSRRERSVWATRFPEEVPLVNGEYEWIALAGADID